MYWSVLGEGCMIYGVYCWRKRLDDNTLQVITRQLNPKLISIMILAIMALSSLAGWLLHLYTDDPQPYLDAFTTVPPIRVRYIEGIFRLRNI